MAEPISVAEPNPASHSITGPMPPPPPSPPPIPPTWRRTTPATASAMAVSFRQVASSPIKSIAAAAVTAGVVAMTMAPATPVISAMPINMRAEKPSMPKSAMKPRRIQSFRGMPRS